MMTATATDSAPVVALRKGAGAAIETTVIVAIDGWTPTPVGIPATTAILVIPANENCYDLRALNETVSAVHPRRHRRQTQRTFLPRLWPHQHQRSERCPVETQAQPTDRPLLVALASFHRRRQEHSTPNGLCPPDTLAAANFQLHPPDRPNWVCQKVAHRFPRVLELSNKSSNGRRANNGSTLL